MSDLSELYDYIREHYPRLGKELSPLEFHEVRRRLNAVTGLDVGPYDDIKSSSAMYLARLKEMKSWET